MKTATEIVHERNRSIAKAGLAFTFGLCASAIALVSADAYFAKTPLPPRATECAIEYTTTDGNLYRPSVADTCVEAWQGFDWNSMPDNWREVNARQYVKR